MTKNTMLRAAASGKLPKKLNDYLNGCRPPPNADPKKVPASFPNLAGFCRYMGCGMSSFTDLRECYPDLYEQVCAVLEDEALNFSLSPTVLTAYLKQRLGYGEKQDSSASEADCGEMRLVFEHDILEDGA